MKEMLSIIVPVYKTESLLDECIHSIIDACNNIDYEIIVVSDASPYDTFGVIEKYMNKNTIRYIKHVENKGLFQARLTGFKAAKGEFITTIDSDDFLFGVRFDKYINNANDENIDIIRFKKYIGMSIASIPSDYKEWMDNQPEFTLTQHDEIWKWFTGDMRWALHGTLFKKELIHSIINIYNTDVKYINANEDLLFSTICFYLAKKFHFANDRGFYFYRQNKESMVRQPWDSLQKVQRVINGLQKANILLNKAQNILGMTDSEKEMLDKCNAINIPFLISKCLPFFVKNKDIFKKFINIYRRDYLGEELVKYNIEILSKALECIETNKTTPPKKICFVLDVLGVGGAQRCVTVLANELCKYNYDIRFLVRNNEIKDYTVNEVIKVDTIIDRNLLNFAKYIEGTDVDTYIFVDHWNYETLKELFLAKFYNKNVICMEHSSYFFPVFENRIKLYKERGYFYQFADVITCLNDVDEFIWRMCHSVNAVYIPNPCYLKPDVKVRSFEDREDSITIIGRICPIKGLYKLIELVNSLKNFDIKVNICGRFGSDEYRDEFYSSVEKDALKNVNIMNFVNNIDDVLRQTKVHVLLSEIEGSPMVIGESRAVGTPTLLVGKHYIDNSHNGCLHIDGGIEDFVREILSVIRDKDRWEVLSKDCFTNIDNWDADKIARRWNDLLINIGNNTQLGHSDRVNFDNLKNLMIDHKLRTDEAIEFINSKNHKQVCSAGDGVPIEKKRIIIEKKDNLFLKVFNGIKIRMLKIFKH